MRSLSSVSGINKKAQVSSLGPTMIVLILAAVVLVFGLIITQSIRDTDVVRFPNSASVNNESTDALVDDTGEALDGAVNPGCSAQIVAVWHGTEIGNTTFAQLIAVGNYTVADCTLTAASGIAGDNETIWNVTYDYRYGGEAYVSANETIVGLGTFADFWEIIVLAIIITIVMGLLLIVFGGRRGR